MSQTKEILVLIALAGWEPNSMSALLGKENLALPEIEVGPTNSVPHSYTN
jgi:hypothetical protein